MASSSEDEQARARAKSRSARIRALFEDPDNEIWVMHAPSNEDVRTKLHELELFTDSVYGNVEKVFGELGENYYVVDNGAADATRLAYRMSDGQMRHARPTTRSVSIVFRSEGYSGIVDSDEELHPQSERVYSAHATGRKVRFPTADGWEDHVSEELKEGVRELELEAANNLPKIDRVAVPEKIIEEKPINVDALVDEDPGKEEVKEEPKEEPRLEENPRPRKKVKVENGV